MPLQVLINHLIQDDVDEKFGMKFDRWTLSKTTDHTQHKCHGTWRSEATTSHEYIDLKCS
jgi:hypothetical protein